MSIKQRQVNDLKIELSQGINGAGKDVWIVTCEKILPDGVIRCLKKGTHYFDNLPEAESWFTWAY